MDDKVVKKSPPASPSQGGSAQKPQKESVSYTRSSKQGAIGSFADRMRGVFSNRTTAIFAVLVLAIGIGAATLAVQRSTETRQRAATILPQGPCYPLGDTNLDGKVDNVDALLILRFVNGLSITGTFIQSNGDVNRDGKTDSVDSLLIQRYITGLDPTFSGCPILTSTPTPRPTYTPAPTPTRAPAPTPALNSSITGHVFMDIGGGTTLSHEGNGIKEPEETGKSSVTVTLNTGATRTTGADGSFSFSGLPIGTYTLTTNVPAGNVISPGSTTSKAVTLSATSPNGIADSGIINLESLPCYLPASILTKLGLPATAVKGYGDVDGDGYASAKDALKILRFVSALDIPSPEQIEESDVYSTLWDVLSRL